MEAITQSSIRHYSDIGRPPFISKHSCRGRRLRSMLTRKSKESSLDSACLGTRISLVPDPPEKCSTPYRLPRIAPSVVRRTLADDAAEKEAEEKVWGRFGYEDVIRVPVLSPRINKVFVKQPWPEMTPATARPVDLRPAGQRYRNSSRHGRHGGYESLLQTTEMEELYGPAPTPAMSRSVSPVKSVHSLHWALGDPSYPIFDLKGRSSKQGPFSRQFTVRCTAPACWLQMKWGRCRTTVHCQQGVGGMWDSLDNGFS